MSASATPKQGDHVFNTIETAMLTPFDTIRSLRSPFVDGQHFLHDYLLHSYSLARNIADAFTALGARSLSASAGVEQDALRELSNLRARYPALRRVQASLLRQIHVDNASEFGAAAKRFEIELLKSVQAAVQAAVAPAGSRPPAQVSSPGIACQQMLGSAYDSASALVVVTKSMLHEAAQTQPAFHNVIVAIAETLDRPAMWRDPYANFREQKTEKPAATSGILKKIRDIFFRIEGFKPQTSAFAGMIRSEIGQKSRLPGAGGAYGAMLHLLHARLQQMQA